MNNWLKFGDRGISSEKIFSVLTGITILKDSWDKFGTHPSDPSDFNRCSKLVKSIPELKTKLYKMKKESVVWAKIIDNWDKLEKMLEETVRQEQATGKNDGKMYKFMKSLGC